MSYNIGLGLTAPQVLNKILISHVPSAAHAYTAQPLVEHSSRMEDHARCSRCPRNDRRSPINRRTLPGYSYTTPRNVERRRAWVCLACAALLKFWKSLGSITSPTALKHTRSEIGLSELAMSSVPDWTGTRSRWNVSRKRTHGRWVPLCDQSRSQISWFVPFGSSCFGGRFGYRWLTFHQIPRLLV